TKQRQIKFIGIRFRAAPSDNSRFDLWRDSYRFNSIPSHGSRYCRGLSKSIETSRVSAVAHIAFVAKTNLGLQQLVGLRRAIGSHSAHGRACDEGIDRD